MSGTQRSSGAEDEGASSPDERPFADWRRTAPSHGGGRSAPAGARRRRSSSGIRGALIALVVVAVVLAAAVVWTVPELFASPRPGPVPTEDWVGASSSKPTPSTSSSPTDDPSVSAEPEPSASPTSASPSPSATDQAVSTLADPQWLNRMSAQSGIPRRALAAYAGAALAEAERSPSCGIGWNTLAAIGDVESGHGSLGGSHLGEDGRALPRVLGVALNGTGVAAIPDTDLGRLDGDARWDRAVGPMQFLPSTWSTHGVDGSGDGIADIDNIDDTALSAADYLCEVGGDLTVGTNWIAAIGAYNADISYNNQVAERAQALAALA